MNGFDADCMHDALRFSYRAMGTTFEVFVADEDPVYAKQAARASFQELEELENKLSRFRRVSDVSRINAAKAGRKLRVSLSTFACLEAARKIFRATGGAFDVTAGFLAGRVGMDLLVLDKASVSVTKKSDEVTVDLGGVGKGFAVDRMADLLKVWSIENALVHGGFSSVYAFGDAPGGKGWPVSLRRPGTTERPCGGEILRSFVLQERGVSGSSSAKGAHIIDPRTCRPVNHVQAAWACTENAAEADALSTAFMVMKPAERAQFQKKHPDVMCIVV